MAESDPKTESLDERRFGLEQRKLAIETERLDLERRRLAVDNRFLNRHLGVIVTGIASLAALALSGTQLYIADANRKADIEIAEATRKADIEAAKLAQQRQWGIQLAEFVFANKDVIFGGATAERETMRNVLLVTYPPEVTAPLFQKLKATTPAEERAVWQTGADIAQKLLFAEISLASGSSASIPGTSLVLSLTAIDASEPDRLRAGFSVRSPSHQEMIVQEANPGDSFTYEEYQIRLLSLDADDARFSVGRRQP